MYITGHLESVFPEEHRKEILRYIYYHQVFMFIQSQDTFIKCEVKRENCNIFLCQNSCIIQ